MAEQILALQQESGETVSDFHDRLMAMYGCEGCPEYCNNGCGNWEIAGYRFDAYDTGVEQMEYPDGWQCWHPERGCGGASIIVEGDTNNERAAGLTSLQTALMDAYISNGVSPDVAARCTSYSLWQYMGTEGKVQ